MRYLPLLICVFSVFSAVPRIATAQNLSLGILAGGGLTDGFQTGISPDGTRFFSTSKDYLVGPAIGWSFSTHWAVEGDALFRELHLGVAGLNTNGTPGSTNREPVVTWEFPVLAKYRFRASGMRPLLEAGASFRTTGNLNGTNPSHYGFTAGAGVEMHAVKLNFVPVVRYTRWAQDAGSNFQAKSNPDQLELAVGVNTTTGSDRHPLGTDISMGALVGANLTNDTRSTGFAFVTGAQSFSETTSPRSGIIGGPTLELQLPANFSVELDAIYRPVRSTTITTSNGMALAPHRFSLGNWDLPVLAKYRFRSPFGSPIIEGGPAFRVGSGDLSHYGVAAGLGLELRVRSVRIVPTLRYSHWAADNSFGSTDSIRNRLDLLVAFYL
jgi:hypothetical protein